MSKDWKELTLRLKPLKDVFDPNELTSDIIVNSIRDIKIIHHCRCCGKKIETFWDHNNHLKGSWIAKELGISFFFRKHVADPFHVYCIDCYSL